MASHSHILAWKIQRTDREVWQAIVPCVARVGHNLVTQQQQGHQNQGAKVFS